MEWFDYRIKKGIPSTMVAPYKADKPKAEPPKEDKPKKPRKRRIPGRKKKT